MLAYARALGVTYYAQNYASIIRQPLLSRQIKQRPDAESNNHEENCFLWLVSEKRLVSKFIKGQPCPTLSSGKLNFESGK